MGAGEVDESVTFIGWSDDGMVRGKDAGQMFVRV